MPTSLLHGIGVRRRTVVPWALATILAIAGAGPAAAASTVTRDDLTGTTFLNPCTAEPITITDGTFQLVANTSVDAGGGLHLQLRGSAQGVVATGIESGTAYHLSGDFWTELNVRDAGFPMTMQLVEVHNAVSAGSADNLIVHIIRHLTVSSRGEVTASVDTVSVECRG